MQIYCTEQLPVEGVPFLPDWDNHKSVSWGVVKGTDIGYIYVWSWMSRYKADIDFSDAVYDLLNNHKLGGLILDFRSNVGGDRFKNAVAGYSQLFNFDVYIRLQSGQADQVTCHIVDFNRHTHI